MKNLFGEEEIRYLGWKQPFAALMLFGKIETRTWDTNYRGLVLICASKQFYSESKIMEISGEVQTQRAFVTLLAKGKTEERGKAIAIGRLVHSRLMTKADEDNCFVKYKKPWEVKNKKGVMKTKKLYCHIYEDVKPIKPFDIEGSQGWRKLDQETISKIQLVSW